MEVSIPLRLVGVMIVILMYLVHPVFKAEDPTYVISFKKNVTLVCNKNLQTDFFKTGNMIETSYFYTLLSVWMTLTFIQDHGCMTNQNPL